MVRRFFWIMWALAIPLPAQYKEYSDWTPTNEAGVNYRWVVDDLSPRACTVQVNDGYLDGVSAIRIFIAYRNRSGAHIQMELSLNLARISHRDAERLLLGCRHVDRVAVERIARR
jgi:hypothetical protein